jgi:hypothetical protein
VSQCSSSQPRHSSADRATSFVPISTYRHTLLRDPLRFIASFELG